jgi:hypothetical protein
MSMTNDYNNAQTLAYMLLYGYDELFKKEESFRFPPLSL